MSRKHLGLGAIGVVLAGVAFAGARADEGYEATHRDWDVICSICALEGEQLCIMQTNAATKIGDHGLSLLFHLNPGTRPTLALDVPAPGPEPVRFAVDKEEPVVLVPPDIALGYAARLVLQSDAMTDTLIAAFRRGSAVTVTFSDDNFEKQSASFSLKGFGAALDAMVAHLPANPRTCAD
jgi:invasion protein IalB